MAKMNKNTAVKVAEVLKAVAHPVRLRIIELLKHDEKCVGDIVKGIGGKQSITSQQLNMMKDKGILSCKREGTKSYYKIQNMNVIKLLNCIYNHCENK